MYTVERDTLKEKYQREHSLVFIAREGNFTYKVGMNFQASAYQRITFRSLSTHGEDPVDFSDLPSTRIGEFPEIDKEWNRRNRIVIKNKRRVLAEAVNIGGLPQWLNELLESKLSFSRKAGCNCGCSPGFKLPGGYIDGRGYITHMWVERKAVDAP